MQSFNDTVEVFYNNNNDVELEIHLLDFSSW